MKKPIALIADWWRTAVDTEVVLKDYRSSKDFESSVQGFASTPSTDIYESISSINHLREYLYYDVIKLALGELNKFTSTRDQFSLPDELEWPGISPENIREIFHYANDMEINIGLLWAAFMQKSDLFDDLLELGAQISFYEHNYGLSALHLAAYRGCTKSTEYLLSQKGCYVNLMCKCYSPLHCAAFGDSTDVAALLLKKGANIDALTNDLHSNLEGVLHCAVRADAVNCLKLFCDEGANINQVDSSGRTAIHLAAELGHARCLQVLVEAKGANIDQQTKEKQKTALHFAAQENHADCIDVLLDHGALPNIADFKLHTPLHVAAKGQCTDCVKVLLRKGKANPNLQDTEQKTALHLTVAKFGRVNSSDVVKQLIRYGADINAKDSQGYTPLHLAAQNELSEAVETLILSGADITAKCKSGMTALGMICRKTPASIDAIRKRLDASIVFNHHDLGSKEFELQIDFTPILQDCYPKEISVLSALLDEGQKELLLHPVCTAFLHLKWKKIRKYFVIRALGCFLLVVAMSAYILMGLSKYCYNFSKNITLITYEQDKDLCHNHSFLGHFVATHPYIIEIQWYLMLFFSVGITFRKLCSIPGYSSLSQYICNIENFLDWSTVVTVFLISFVYTGRTYIWQNHVSAFGVLMAWINFLYLLGQFPFFGTYIAMYSSVQREFGKLFLVFSCLLVGFTVSFCVLFPESEVFANVYIGFITILVMAIGEMNLDLITNSRDDEKVFVLRGSTEIIYAAFVTCVTIILLNLLVGIAVHDIQGLKKTAKFTKLSKETKLIHCIESALFTDYFHGTILAGILRWTTVVSVNGSCVLNVKPLNHREGLLPRDILESAYEVARKHKRKNKTKLSYYHNQQAPLLRAKNQTKYDKSGVENDLRNDMRKLNDEMLSIRNVLESNQRLMEQILRVVNANDEC